MQYIVDTYKLEYLEDEDKYYISFEDSVGNECRLEIEKDIFEAYIESKKSYVRIKNNNDRYMEKGEFIEEQVCNRNVNRSKSAEEQWIANITKEKILQAKKTLTKTQLKRIELHYIENMSIRDLAELEKVRKNQIEKSIKLRSEKNEKIF